MLDVKQRTKRFNKIKKEHQKWWEHMRLGAHFDDHYSEALVRMQDENQDRSIPGTIDLRYHSKMELAKANVGMMEGNPIESVQQHLCLSLSYNLAQQSFARLVCKIRNKSYEPLFKYQESSNCIAEGLLLAVLLDDEAAMRFLRDFLLEVRANNADSTLPCDQSFLNLALFLTAMQLGEPLPDLKAVKGYQLIMQSLKGDGDLSEGIMESLDYHLSCAVEANDVYKEMDACFEPPSDDAFHHIHAQLFPIEIYTVMLVAKRQGILFAKYPHPMVQLYDYNPLLNMKKTPRAKNELLELSIGLLKTHDIESACF